MAVVGTVKVYASELEVSCDWVWYGLGAGG